MKKYIFVFILGLTLFASPVKAETLTPEQVAVFQSTINQLLDIVKQLMQQLAEVQAKQVVVETKVDTIVQNTVQNTQVIPTPTAPIYYGSTNPVQQVKEINITASFRDPRTLTESGLGFTSLVNGGNAYISSYIGSAQINFNVEYKIDGKVQPVYTYEVKRTMNPNVLDITTPGLYTYMFEINGLTKTFNVNVLADPTNCKDRNLQICIGEYQNSL